MRPFGFRLRWRFSGLLGWLVLFGTACSPPPPVQPPTPRTLEPEWNDGQFNTRGYDSIHRHFPRRCLIRYPDLPKNLTRDCP